jgi:hypothetical protein
MLLFHWLFPIPVDKLKPGRSDRWVIPASARFCLGGQVCRQLIALQNPDKTNHAQNESQTDSADNMRIAPFILPCQHQIVAGLAYVEGF